jgi:hypothetical protein
MKKIGTLYLHTLNGDKSTLLFIEKDTSKKVWVRADLAGIRKWFCSSTEEQARNGVSGWMNGNTLWTDEWHLRCASESMAGYSQLSFNFC